jgi:hypothetical protein
MVSKKVVSKVDVKVESMVYELREKSTAVSTVY